MPIMLSDGGEGHRQAILDRLRGQYAPSHPLQVAFDVREGNPQEVILQSAGELEADLIVMGTHGRSGLDRLVVGSVAEAVIRHAPVPVLALRSPDFDIEGDGLKVLLHPTDFSESANEALEVACTLAQEIGARVVLVHVALGAVVAGGSFAIPTDLRMFREPLDELKRRADDKGLKEPVEAQLRQGEIAAEILAVAEETETDLIVMGTHGRTALGRFFMGSVAEEVLREAEIPVLVVKGHVPPHTDTTVNETTTTEPATGAR